MSEPVPPPIPNPHPVANGPGDTHPRYPGGPRPTMPGDLDDDPTHAPGADPPVRAATTDRRQPSAPALALMRAWDDGYGVGHGDGSAEAEDGIWREPHNPYSVLAAVVSSSPATPEGGRAERQACPECGNPIWEHDGLGGPDGCTLTDNGVAQRLHAPAPSTLPAETREGATAGQAAAKALWESLPEGAPVVVEFLGSGPRLARRTDIGWESDDGDTRTGCTPWSVRVDEVYVRADHTPAASPAVSLPGEEKKP